MPLSSRDMSHVLNAANAMADASGRVILPHFRESIEVINKKSDESELDPVTEADRESELAIRRVIEAQFPNDAILGEEFGRKPGNSGYEWILDPIDGTGAFISGIPLWGTLIALHDGQRAVFGMMDQPFLGERYTGYAGHAELVTEESRQAGCASLRCHQQSGVNDNFT